MGKHHKAIDYAKKAIFVVKEELVEIKLSKPDEFAQKSSILGIAYFNYAVEEEFLGNFSAAVKGYYKAYKIVKKNDPGNAELMKKFFDCYTSLKNKNINSRPSSAKTAASIKSAVSGTFFKSALPGKNSNKNNERDKLKNHKKNNSFVEFQNQCKMFLSGGQEFAKPPPIEKNQEHLKNVKKKVLRIPIRPQATTPNPPLKNLEIPNIIKNPVVGVENIRKPVMHEIHLKPSEPKVLQKQQKVSKIQDFKEEKKNLYPQISSNPSVSNFKHPRSPVFFEDSDIVVPNTIEANKHRKETKKDSNSSNLEKNQPKNAKSSQKSKNNLLKDLNSPEFLKALSKVQARVRGFLVREKLKLSKSKKATILYRRAKKINEKL